MKRLFTTIFLLAFAFTASATQLNITGDLTPEQKAQIILQAEQMANQAKMPDVPKVEKVKEWVEVGTAIGEGMAGAAGKLGVEVNKFADTYVGKFTMFVIAWHYMGQEVVNILFGISIWAFGIPTWIWMFRSRGSRRVASVTKYEKGAGPDGKTEVIEYAPTSEEMKGWYLGTLAVLMIIGTLPIIV